MFVLT